MASTEPEADRPPDRPVILAVEDDADVLARIVGNLSRRYRADYDVMGESGPSAALVRLDALRDAGAEVALIAASHWMGEETGTAFLTRARSRFPTARRVAMANFADLAAMPPIARASTLGEIDAYADLPWSATDERFLSTIGDILADWAREHGRQVAAFTIVGSRDQPEARLLTNVLQSWDVGHTFLDADSPDGRSYISRHDLAERLPAVELPDHRLVPNATLAKMVDLFDVKARPAPGMYDVVVIGLGPAGLSAGLNAASEGLRVLMVESGFSQASSSPMIRNYLGFPAGVRGAELQRRAWMQAILFGAEHRVGRSARDLRTDGDALAVVLDDGEVVRTRAVVLATGVAYRRIGIPSVEALVGRGVFYTYSALEAQALEGESAAVVGGANSAAQAAAHLARYARRVTLLVRGEALAATASEYLVEQLEGLANVEVRLNTEIVEARDRHQLRTLVVRDNSDGTVDEIDVAGVFLMIGSVPRTEWLPGEIARDEQGFVLTGSDAPAGAHAGRDRLPFETTMPGVFAAGDVRAGSVKRVAAAVGEGAQAIQQVHRFRGAATPVRAGSR